MSYREVAPPVSLSRHVACLWRADGPGSGSVLPDGCADVVWTGDALIVAGPDSRAARTGAAAGPVRLGVRFRVGAADAVLGLPAHALADARVPLAELWPEGEAVAERVALATDPDAALAELTAAVAARARGAAEPDPAVRAAAAALADPRARVRDLAADLGFSQRHLLRRFRASVGYGPKTLARVLRLQRFLAAVRSGEHDLAWIAADAGYADQSHLARECAALADATPSALAAAGRMPAGERALLSSG